MVLEHHLPLTTCPQLESAAVEPGLSAAVEHAVAGEDTAQALGSGDVPVLGTPRLLALAEAATVAALAGHLPAGSTSVGVRVELEHLAATPVGGRVLVRAELTSVDGRTLGFAITATDRAGRTVGGGAITRAVVDRERFLSKV